MVFRTLFIALIALSFLPNAASQVPLEDVLSFGPSETTASAGEIVTYNVNVRTFRDRFVGGVLVTVPQGIEVVGNPQCQSGCSGAFAQQGADGTTQVEASFTLRQDEQAAFSFEVQVPYDAGVGDIFFLTARLLGGVTAFKQAESRLVVGESPVDVVPSSTTRAFVWIRPANHSIPPGQSTLFIISGDYQSNPNATVRMDIRIDEGLSLVGEPRCVYGYYPHTVKASCDLQIIEHAERHVSLQANGEIGPGNALEVIFEVKADEGLIKGDQRSVSTEIMRKDGDTYVADNHSSATVTIAPEPPLLSPEQPGVIVGSIETHWDIIPFGDSCMTSNIPTGMPIVLYEEGDTQNPIASSTLMRGELGDAAKEFPEGSCTFGFQFENVPAADGYVLARYSDDSLGMSRSAFIGLIPADATDQHVVVPFN